MAAQKHAPVLPGEVLRVYLDQHNMTQAQLADVMGLNPVQVNTMINGRTAISPIRAVQLAAVFPHTTPEFWLNLQTKFDLHNAKLALEALHWVPKK